MKLPTFPTFIAAFALGVSAAPATDNHLAPRAGTWSIKAYNLSTASCKNAYRLFEGSESRGCTDLTFPATAISIDADVDCVITVYADQGCPVGAGKAFGPGVEHVGCAAETVGAFKVDCGVV